MAAVQDLHVWCLDDGLPVLTVVLSTPLTEISAVNALADEIRHQLHEEFGVEHATIECRHLDAAAPYGPDGF